MTTTLAFVHHKGGTGKTTSCLSISGFLAKKNKNVLIIDIDPQGSATSGLGIDRRKVDGSIYDVMVDEKELEDVIIETENGISLAPATLDLMGAKPVLYRRGKRINILKNKLEDLERNLDYILIETPTGASLFLINSISGASHVIVTC